MKKIIFLIFMIFLSSCGQKGALYLPEENNNNSEKSSFNQENLENNNLENKVKQNDE